jgi:hypothetical protein
MQVKAFILYPKQGNDYVAKKTELEISPFYLIARH